MTELLAGYASYASTEAIVQERLTAMGSSEPDTGVTFSMSLSGSFSLSWTWSWSWTF